MTQWLARSRDEDLSLPEATFIIELVVFQDEAQVEVTRTSRRFPLTRAWVVVSLTQFPSEVVASATVSYLAVAEEVTRADFCMKASKASVTIPLTGFFCGMLV